MKKFLNRLHTLHAKCHKIQVFLIRQGMTPVQNCIVHLTFQGKCIKYRLTYSFSRQMCKKWSTCVILFVLSTNIICILKGIYVIESLIMVIHIWIVAWKLKKNQIANLDLSSSIQILYVGNHLQKKVHEFWFVNTFWDHFSLELLIHYLKNCALGYPWA